MRDLHAAAAAGDAPTVRRLLAEGADVGALVDGEPPLLAACWAGHVDVARLLMEAGADPKRTNEWGFHALGAATWESHIELAEYLAEGWGPLSMDAAASLGRLDRLDALWVPDEPPTQAIGAYLMACRCGARDAVAWFLDRGTEIDLHPSGDEWGGIRASALHHAAVKGHLRSCASW